MPVNTHPEEIAALDEEKLIIEQLSPSPPRLQRTFHR